MCSRYSAFYLGKTGYLIATLHPDHRQQNDEQEQTETINNTQWLGLKIISHQPAKLAATVEFCAFYQDTPVGQLHEKSHFIKQQGQWYYLWVFLHEYYLIQEDLNFRIEMIHFQT
mgnify:CR=1 FL=1